MPDHTELKLIIAHINDTHSYFDPSSVPLTIEHNDHSYECFVSVGGFARIKTRLEQLREEAREKGRTFATFHAGDCFQGSLYFSVFKGRANIDLLNALSLDAMALGNHELDLGNLPVAKLAQGTRFPLLCGNWDLSAEDSNKPLRLSDNPSVISYDSNRDCANWITLGDGNEKVAVFGLSMDKMQDISSPDKDTPFKPTLEVARNTVAQINQNGINKIILLSHMGYDADQFIAEQVEGIALIIGGHSHVLQGDFTALGLEKADDYGIKINDTFIVQSGLYAKALGHCEINFAADGTITQFTGQNELLVGRQMFADVDRNSPLDAPEWKAIKEKIDSHPLVKRVVKDQSVVKLLNDKYATQVRRLHQEKIAFSERRLRHVRLPDSQGGSEVAPLVAQAFYESAYQRGYQVDFALHNAGGVRCSLEEGWISHADIMGGVLPFAIPIGIYTVSGVTLKAVLEGAINNATSNGCIGTGEGSYPYGYGLHFDYVAQNAENERIENLKILKDDKWVSVQNNALYVGVSSIYTMGGKEGYDAILETQAPSVTLDITMGESFVEYLKGLGQVTSSSGASQHR